MKIRVLFFHVLLSAYYLAADPPIFHAPFDNSDQATFTAAKTSQLTPYTSMRGPFVPGSLDVGERASYDVAH